MSKRPLKTIPKELAALRETLLARLAERIRERLKSGEIDAAADATGLNRSTLYKWRNGKQQPGVIDLLLLARFVGLTVSELIGEEPLRRETPYEKHPSIARLDDALVTLRPEEKISLDMLLSLLVEAIRNVPADESIQIPPYVPRTLGTFDLGVPYTGVGPSVRPGQQKQVDDTGAPRAKRRV